MASLRRAAGSLLVVGLGGTELTGLERAWLRVVRPAGMILFRRNIADVGQTRALLDEATGLGAMHSLRCVDVEGGTVDRLRDALAPLPSAQAVARADQYPTVSEKTRKDGAPRLTPGSTPRSTPGLDGARGSAVLERHTPAAIRASYRTEAELQYLTGTGVSAASIWRLREALDAAGFPGGENRRELQLTAEKCRMMAAAAAPIDVVGTSSIFPSCGARPTPPPTSSPMTASRW